MTSDELLDAWASLTGSPPNPEQRRVMEPTDGPLWVIAGPGTGKTFALILRCLYLLCVCHVSPKAIVLTTFTRNAAEELKYRLQEALLRLSAVFPELREIDISQIRLGTLHSLCWDILTETPGSELRHVNILSALDRAFFVYTRSRFCNIDYDSETEKLFLQLVSWIAKKSYRKLPSRWQRARLFITIYERLMNDQVDRTRFANSSPERKLLIQLIEEYEAALCEHHLTDQTLMQQQALEILCSSQGRQLVQGIEHVIVDEYQDTNPLQAAIYRALAASPPHHLCIVGDDDQALYRFRGGTVGCMVRFPEECKQTWPDYNVKRISLTETYRSHPSIVDWINQYISAHPQMLVEGARVHEKASLRAQPSLYPAAPVVVAIRGKKTQDGASNFVEVLRSLKDQGVIESYDQCALLAYSIKPGPRNDTTQYISELQSQGIPVTLPTSSKDQLVYKQILGTLLIALDRAGNYIPATFAANNATLARYVEECRNAVLADPVLAPMARQINTWLLTQKGAAQTMSLTKLAQRILNAQPCIDAIQKDKGAEVAVHTLIQTLDAYDRIVEHGYHIPLEDVHGKKRIKKWWMERIYYILLEGVHQEHFERGDDMVVPSPPDALRILTIHRSKGLEFPVVAVVVDKSTNANPDATHRLEQEVLPFRKDLAFEKIPIPTRILGGDEEARAIQDVVRRHYVAYSRAQSILLLLICDDHLKSSPPALGLGADKEWFSNQVQVWPSQQKKISKQKRDALKTIEGVKQNGLWG